MGKKYLETKKGSLEQSVLGIWQTAIEEGDARIDGRTKGYKDHRSKLEASRIRRENKKKSMNEDQGFTDEELDEISDEEFDIFEMSDEMFEATMKKKSAGERKAAAKKRAKWMKTSGGKKALMKAKKRAAKVRKGQIKVDPKKAKAAKKRAKLYSGDDTFQEELDYLTDEELDQLTNEELSLFEMSDEMFEATMKKRSAADRKAAAKKRAKWMKTSGGKKALMKAKKRAAKVRKGQIKVDPKKAKAAKKRAKLYSGDDLDEWKTLNANRRVDGGDKRRKENKEITKEGSREEYTKFFNKALDKFDIDSPADLKSDEEKKKFFNYVDKNWTGDHEEEVNESIDWTKASNREWGTDELRKHTEDVTPGQEGEWSEAVNAKNQTMREALAQVWGFDEGKSPFKNEDKKSGKTLTGKKVASIDINPTIKEKTK